MADIFASVNGTRIKSASLIIPFKGLWTADIYLDQPVTLSGKVTFVLGPMTLIGTPNRTGEFLGSGSVQLVGGAGGWMKTIPPKPYQQSAGLRLAPILGDAAREVGETVNVTADRTLGAFFPRQKGPASRLLQRFADEWWVDFQGVTQVGVRKTPVIASAFDVLAEGTDLTKGVVRIATDFPQDWQPGCYFTSPTMTKKQASTVIHTLSSTKLRTDIWIM